MKKIFMGWCVTFACVIQLHAVPAGFNVQGRLTDANGINKDGNLQMVFSIFADESGGAALWEQSFSVTVKNGGFQVILQGADKYGKSIEDAVKDLDKAYVQIQAGSEPPMVPRQPLLRSPFAASDKVTSKSDVTIQSDSQGSGSGNIILKTGSSTRVTIQNNGDMVLGNAAPGQKVTVAANAEINGDLSANNLVGAVMWFYRTSCPNGFLAANGTAVLSAQYPALAAVMGKSGTFNLPDLRGEFIRGLDNGRGVDPSRVVGSTQAYQLESHKHGTDMYGPRPAYGTANWFINTDPNYGTMRYTKEYGGAETRPRNVALLPCIKY